MSNFDMVLFKQRMLETISWCVPRFQRQNPAQSLRTLPIPDEPLTPNLDTLHVFAQTIFQKRAIAYRGSNQTAITGLGGGRLLLIFLNWCIVGSPHMEESGGFLDTYDLPPWDTWLYYGHEVGVPHNNQKTFQDIDYLLAWVPAQVVEDISLIVREQDTPNLAWLEKSPWALSFVPRLEREGYFSNYR
jgi:hypothetical protein